MDVYEFVMQHQWWRLVREDRLMGSVITLSVMDRMAIWMPYGDAYPDRVLKFPSEALAQATADNLNNRARGDGLMMYLDPEHQILCELLLPAVSVGDEPCHVVKQTRGE